MAGAIHLSHYILRLHSHVAGARRAARPQLRQHGAQSFLFKGTNGRWRDVLTPDDLARYQEQISNVLSEEAARWLEQGSLATGRRPEAR